MILERSISMMLGESWYISRLGLLIFIYLGLLAIVIAIPVLFLVISAWFE